MQKIETYLPQRKNYGAIGTSMIKTIETLNPHFSLSFLPQPPPGQSSPLFRDASHLRRISDTEPLSPHYQKSSKPARATCCSCSACSARYWPRALLTARVACASGLLAVHAACASGLLAMLATHAAATCAAWTAGSARACVAGWWQLLKNPSFVPSMFL